MWHRYLPEARPASCTPIASTDGPHPTRHRFNPHKLLIDPYAREISGPLSGATRISATRSGTSAKTCPSTAARARAGWPNASGRPRVELADDRRPEVPWHDIVIYETHVRGYTMQHPGVPPALRGTFAGMSGPPVIDHLKRLGVRRRLLPIHAYVDDRTTGRAGLRNYWGYNSIGFFAPEQRYLASDCAAEFKTMVKALHLAGLEVVLDVVYNHTAEGNHTARRSRFRGIDNAAYYRLNPDEPRSYVDYTGCGNSLNMLHPRVLQLVTDSLRYWVEEITSTVFASTSPPRWPRSARLRSVRRRSSTFCARTRRRRRWKLIAEPWDLGTGGYQVGNFPVGWREWNDQYRDAMRVYSKGDGGLIGDFARRLTGSSDISRTAVASLPPRVNFVTAHDGFTLHYLVSYNDKHNEANGEGNRDGNNNNLAWNCGVEGETDDPAIIALREKQKRNLLGTLLLSQGVPMLQAGDERRRSAATTMRIVRTIQSRGSTGPTTSAGGASTSSLRA